MNVGDIVILYDQIEDIIGDIPGFKPTVFGTVIEKIPTGTYIPADVPVKANFLWKVMICHHFHDIYEAEMSVVLSHDRPSEIKTEI